jgi:transcriptional regulator with XRE-family HTH domain
MASQEFGPTVRRWRDRVTPAAAGLPAGGRRRAAGLRREELAQLAGISVDYITRLEQGRASSPSAQVTEALARALRLSPGEREHLFRLAGLQPPGPDTIPAFITPSVQRLLDRLSGVPVVVYDASWTLLTANRPYSALMGDQSQWRGNERNAVWRRFLRPEASRVRETPQARQAIESAVVADLRVATARYPADHQLRRLVAELRAKSPRFARLWDEGAIGRHEAARKTIDHPSVGPLTLDCDVITVAGSDLRMMIYTAEPGTEDAERLALLTILGTQALAGMLDALQPLDPLIAGGDKRLLGEDLLHQDAVHLRVGVGAGVGQHRQPVVQVGGLAQRRQHHSGRRDPGEHERARPRGPQQHVEVAAAERADAALDDDRLPVGWRQRRVNLGGRVRLGVEVVTGCLNRAERHVRLRRLRVPRAERDPHEHHRDPGRPRGLDGAVGRVDDGRRADPLDDAVLEVHDQQDRTGTGHGLFLQG